MARISPPRRAADVSWREIGQDVVVVPIRTSVDQPLCVHTLNSVGAFIWLLLDGNLTEHEIAARVAEQFEVDEQRAYVDLRDYLEELAASELLESDG
ncbi:MAG: PqqD family protein [Pseudomonadota bacterium]